MIQSVKQLVPKPVKRSIRPPYDSARSRVRFALLQRDLRKRYGPGLVYTVAEQDEMFEFIHDSWKWPHHVERMRAQSDAMRTYLVSGDVMVRDLETALRDQGRTLSDLDSFLEFASGYGRFTRFLVTRLDPAKVTVSDIDQSAVDFSTRTFGVSGFYSTADAADLDHAGQYEVVFIASLFSHLAIECWTPWLERMYALVAPGGLLVFSTHGLYAREVIYGEHWRDKFEEPADGFSFLRTNETDGRLPFDYYGSTFVTEAFVKDQIEARGLGVVKRVYPSLLWGSQDLYVVERPAL